jgi:hypothetical protein
MLHLEYKNVSPETFLPKTKTIKFYLKPVKISSSGFKVYTQIVFNRTKAECTTGLSCKNTDRNAHKEEFAKKYTLFKQ